MNNNPLRYRGYVYDVETKLYYCQSRYYDPEVGRFINADSLASTGQGVLGNNMFAYCNNCPVICSDAVGNRAQVCIDDEQNMTKMPWSYSNTGGKSFYSLITYSSNPNPWLTPMVIDYIINSDEQVVLNAKYFAFYKGCLVIRTNRQRSGSLGIIFLTRETNSRPDPVGILRHEYGHVIQLAYLGLANYVVCIGIPSMFEWGNALYYNNPQEITASILGNGILDNPTQAQIISGFKYLQDSYFWGPYALFMYDWSK